MRILVIAHEASRTGSPTVLRALLAWLDRHADVEIEVVVVRDGGLRGALTRYGPSRVLGPGEGADRAEMAELGLRRVGFGRLSRRVRSGRAAAALRGLARPDVVYVSSVPGVWLLPRLPWSDVPVVTHVHELDATIRSLPVADQGTLVARTDLFIAASAAVEEVLVGTWGVGGDRVVRRQEFIDPGWVERTAGRAPSDPGLAVGIPADAAVVVGAGTPGWRKGCDLFVQLAVALRSAAGDGAPHLVWAGPQGGAEEGWPPARDIEAAGLGGRVHLVGEVEDLGPWLRRAAVCALTSREDALPLVCLEAGWWEVPSVTFDVGGARELTGAVGAAGLVIEPLAVEAMAAAVLALLADPDRAQEMGAEARRRVERAHVSEVVAPQIWADLQRVVGLPVSQR